MKGWKGFFHFNRSERKGIYVLAGILIALLTSFSFLDHLETQKPIDFSEFEKEISAYEASIIAEAPKQFTKKARKLKKSIQLFTFNPNQLPLEDWERLGLSKRQAESIHRYEAKGGKFKKKGDVLKMYVVSDSLFALWEPYILIPPTASKIHEKSIKDEVAVKPGKHILDRKEFIKAEINTADSMALIAVRGIGPAYAKAIINYRNKLGGFIRKEQLKEVYIIDEDAYERIAPALELIDSNIQRINVNQTSIEELKQHPYIRWKVANSIVQYRKAHGAYQEIEELKKSALIDDILFQKISPYLSIE